MAGVTCACCSCVPLRWSFAATSTESISKLGPEGVPTTLELGTERMTRIAQSVWLSRLAPGLWLHTTTAVIGQGVYFPANGLVLERDDGSLLIDTGYLPEHADALLRWSQKSLRSPIKQAVATHFHRDRTGGIPALQAAGIPTVAHPLTVELARSHGMAVPTGIADFPRDAARLSRDCELFFPGAGHTRDNIVVWLPRQRILFGGCLLVSDERGSRHLGDAIVSDWGSTVRNVKVRYRSAKSVVPGHGTITGDPIARTLELLEQGARMNCPSQRLTSRGPRCAYLTDVVPSFGEMATHL